MEKDYNIMPEIKLLKCPPPIEGIARAISKVIRLGNVIEPLSEHNRGASQMLDEQLSLELED